MSEKEIITELSAILKRKNPEDVAFVAEMLDDPNDRRDKSNDESCIVCRKK